MLDDEIDQYLKTLTPIKTTIYGRKKLCYSVSCHRCGKEHLKEKCDFIKGLKAATPFYCSRNCLAIHSQSKISFNCTQCGMQSTRTVFESKKVKNLFCSQHCAATYNNLHKAYGIRRSKLELFIEQQLKTHLPFHTFLCNDKTIIGSELDFYFPQLKLAIQYNGPTHYRPIYGEKKFTAIQRLDKIKREECLKRNIKLIEIDCSKDKSHLAAFKLHWENLSRILAEEAGVAPASVFTTDTLAKCSK